MYPSVRSSSILLVIQIWQYTLSHCQKVAGATNYYNKIWSTGENSRSCLSSQDFFFFFQILI